MSCWNLLQNSFKPSYAQYVNCFGHTDFTYECVCACLCVLKLFLFCFCAVFKRNLIVLDAKSSSSAAQAAAGAATERVSDKRPAEQAVGARGG